MATFFYIVADEVSKTCALIDPAFETDKILMEAETNGYRVSHLINTHCHSDHSAGNASVINATGAKFLIHELDAHRLEKALNRTLSRFLGGKGSPRPDILLKDGDRIEIGEIMIEVIHTPGHTPGGICLYTKGNIFTGDTLFVSGIGRTDLSGGSASQLIESIHERIYTLQDETIVWPGHDYGPSPSSTVAHEKMTNPFTRRI